MAAYPEVKLGKVLEQISRPEAVDAEETYSLLGAHWYAKGLYVKEVKSGAAIRAKQLYAVKSGDFVYNRLFAWKGSFAMAESSADGCYVSNEFPCFKVDASSVDAKYLWYYFSRQSAWYEALGLSSGSTPTSRNRLKAEQFLRMLIPLPPLKEQRRIAARIDELANATSKSKHASNAALSEVDSLMCRALERIFDNVISEHPQYAVGSVCKTTSGGTPSRARWDYYIGGIPWVKSGELKDDFICEAEEHISETAILESSASLIPSGTLLIAMYGANVGLTGVMRMDGATNQAICAITPQSSLNRNYLWWFLRRMKPVFRAVSFGGAQPNISQKVIRETPVPIPPLPEQHRIVAYLDALQAKVDEVKGLQALVQTELDALLPSILDRAFKGEL